MIEPSIPRLLNFPWLRRPVILKPIVDLRLENLFHCKRCQFWYLRDDEEGPDGECKHCFWNIPLNRKAIVTVKMVAMMMARKAEELLVASQCEC